MTRCTSNYVHKATDLACSVTFGQTFKTINLFVESSHNNLLRLHLAPKFMASPIHTDPFPPVPKSLVLMTLTRPATAEPFPPLQPWQGQPIGIWAYSPISANLLRYKLFLIRDAMQVGGDSQAAMLPLEPGKYQLVDWGSAGDGEPLFEFNIVIGKELKTGVLIQRLYWVEVAGNVGTS